jgi:hypothetical protein
MKRYTLIRFDRYEVSKSRVIYHYTHEHNIGLALKEALIQLWGKGEFEEFDMSEIKGFDNQLGIDFEEESYLFFEEKIKLEDTK